MTNPPSQSPPTTDLSSTEFLDQLRKVVEFHQSHCEKCGMVPKGYLSMGCAGRVRVAMILPGDLELTPAKGGLPRGWTRLRLRHKPTGCELEEAFPDHEDREKRSGMMAKLEKMVCCCNRDFVA